MMSSTLSKIHVTNSTGLSLNERFTAISTQPKVVTNIGNRRRSRSRSVQRTVPSASSEHASSRANQRLLAQLQRKHKVQAALKLKRRSMRTVGGGSNGSGANGRIQRGSVKAFRVGANGKPIRTNSLARVATMKADNEMINHRRPLRRSNSSTNLANRLGPRRPTVGGAAQRVAKRNLDRQRGRNGDGRLLVRGRPNGRSVGFNNRGRSRSRSRTRTQSDNGRNRSRSRTRIPDNQSNNRNRSRNRNRNDIANAPASNSGRRGRSRSRSRGLAGIVNKTALPIKARLGVRPGLNRVQNNNRRRNGSLTRRGVQTGRVQKGRNSTNVDAPRAAVSDNNGRGRIRSRSAVRNARNGNVRSRSRTRKGQVGQQKQQQVSGQLRQQQRNNNNNNRAPRGRIQQRRGNNNNNNSNAQRGSNNNGKAQTQQRRGRSRSRTGRGANGGSRNQGNKTTATVTTTATKPTVNKDDLDKELDQYMATTKTEHEMDYLLNN